AYTAAGPLASYIRPEAAAERDDKSRRPRLAVVRIARGPRRTGAPPAPGMTGPAAFRGARAPRGSRRFVAAPTPATARAAGALRHAGALRDRRPEPARLDGQHDDPDEDRKSDRGRRDVLDHLDPLVVARLDEVAQRLDRGVD